MYGLELGRVSGGIESELRKEGEVGRRKEHTHANEGQVDEPEVGSGGNESELWKEGKSRKQYTHTSKGKVNESEVGRGWWE